MWKQRVEKILAAPFEELVLLQGDSDRFRGRYLRLGSALLALGPLVAQGAEAIVFELIDLRAGTRVGVAKICRFAPTTEEYRAWAVPFRFELNPISSKPDVEMYPAHLVRVTGGFVKIQEWISEDPREDWTMQTPAEPIRAAFIEKGADTALQVADEIIAATGRHGIILEMKGSILGELERWEDAREALEGALECYAAEGRAGLLRTGLQLAKVYKQVYLSSRWEGAAARITLTATDGTQHHQIMFSDAKASALDDTLEDRSLYVLLEILGHEPCFLPALLLLAEELAGSQVSYWEAIAVLDAMVRIDPDSEDAKQYKEQLLASRKAHIEAIAANGVSAAQAAETKDSDQVVVAPPSAEARMPAEHHSYLDAFDAEYDPEPQVGKVAEARFQAVWANLNAGRVQRAEAAAKAAMELDPRNVAYPLALAHVLAVSKRSDEAIQLIEDVTRNFPDHPEGFVRLGEFHLERQELAKARLAFLRARPLATTERWRVDMGLGQTYRAIGDRTRAVRHLRSAHGAAPNTAESDTGTRGMTWKVWSTLLLAYSLRDERSGATDVDKAEALDILDKAVCALPDDPDLLVCRGQSLAGAGKIDEATRDFERAAEVAPNHAVAPKIAKAFREHVDQARSTDDV